MEETKAFPRELLVQYTYLKLYIYVLIYGVVRKSKALNFYNVSKESFRTVTGRKRIRRRREVRMKMPRGNFLTNIFLPVGFRVFEGQKKIRKIIVSFFFFFHL